MTKRLVGDLRFTDKSLVKLKRSNNCSREWKDIIALQRKGERL